MKIIISNNPKTDSKHIIVPVSKNDNDAPLKAIAQLAGIEEGLITQDFKAEAGEVHLLYRNGQRLMLLGLGHKTNNAELTRCFRVLSHKYQHKLKAEVAIGLNYDNIPSGIAATTIIEAAINGLLLGSYKIGKYKSQNTENTHPFVEKDAAVTIQTDIAEALALQAAQKGRILAETQMSIFDLVNAPSNKKFPKVLADWAVNSGQQHGYQVKVMDKEEIIATGLHALLAVNQGSPTPPYFIIMEYRHASHTSQALPKIGLVGKGVTFDTGGLSIKPSGNMYMMKSDMGGAAAVLGTMEAAARMQLPVHLIGIVPTTDNSVDAHAVKPSDVIDSYSGKTIEVIDTDAEGRLILADGLAYMVKHYQPDVLIDLATLTGSAVRTFGYHAGALFSNDDALAQQLYQSGEHTGERVWRLPIWDIYKEDFKSDVADIRNFGSRPIAGAIGAAKFLETFTAGHPQWAHMDIAGVAFNDTEFSMQKSATGFGIRLLIDYFNTLSEQ
jgi:leucyl aminopeptidase